ncbi:MAG: hypothetical protein JO086_13280, partial [Acidimicrobiia bacterium]|nr:hypothetical protein [Acidimicrobiia bacterium]
MKQRVFAMSAAAVVGAIALAGCGGNHKTETFRVNITSANGVSGFNIGTVT